MKGKNADTNPVTIINRQDSLRSFISNSPGGLQFSLVVLFALARKYYQDNKSIKNCNKDKQKTSKNFLFTFSSIEFRDTFSRLACELGLDRYLIRQMAFPEYALTLQYLGFIREKETIGEYEFHLSEDEAKWLAFVGLNEMEFGIGSLPTTEHPQYDTHFLRYSSYLSQDNRNMLNEIVLRKSSDERRGFETTRLKDTTPRSRNYGKMRQHYIANKQPPTAYKLRNRFSVDERNRLQKEFEDETCVGCSRRITLEDFDIWVGEPIKRTPLNVQDKRMSDMLANSSTEVTGKSADNNNVGLACNSLDPKLHPTEREILELGYGLLPMDGRDGFIAFAKPLRNCPVCGYSIWNTM
jgi:hypothetical protein